ncbi:ATP-binding cassette sub- G member 5 [Gonapodya sp. JEL0774]|nr:ATP-binding cassette sub- G member 5 [Gonapodya sp. JEL0774]
MASTEATEKLIANASDVAPAADSANSSAAGIPELGQKRMVRMGSWAVKDESELRPSYFSFRDISCILPVKGVDKQLLNGATGYCKPGESLAIMGPSGAGKSTLLDILSYRKTTGRFTQDVMLNGEKLTQRNFIKHNGYVTSDDLLPPELTVREALEFCAALRLPPDWTAEQRNARIEDVLSVMRLNYVENNRIGSALVRGLSTGERKRVNVAVELLPVAAVVFLDEPTTGLDSNTGREVIENTLEVVKLRKLACVATIHQPSYTILRQFDNLLLLANGRMCYFGRTADCISYFETYLGIPIHGNPAEIYADAQAANPDKLIEAWEKSNEKDILEKSVAAIHSGQGSIRDYKPIGLDEAETWKDSLGFYQQGTGWQQIKQLFIRQTRIYIRNPVMSTSRLGAAIFTALFFGLAFFRQDRSYGGSGGKISELFALKLMTPGFGSAAIAYWLEKRKQYYHEEAAGYYNKFFYITTNFLVEFIFLAFMMAICVLIAFSLSNWLTEFFGLYILYFVLECWAVTGWNLVCAYMAAVSARLSFVDTSKSHENCCMKSIPYANAAFNIHYYWGILLAGWYITDTFLFSRPGGSLFQKFLVWTAYPRGVFIPIIRHEWLGQESYCKESEKFIFDLTGISYGGMGDAALTVTKSVINNKTIVDTINSFQRWQYATKAQNDTVKQLYTLAGNLYKALTSQAVLANITTPLPAPANVTQLFGLVSTEVTRQAVALGQYAVVNVADTKVLTATVTGLLTASSMIGFADFLYANPLNGSATCFYNTGRDFLLNGVSLALDETRTYENGTTYTVPGFDDVSVTPSWIYCVDNVAQGIFMFLIAQDHFLALQADIKALKKELKDWEHDFQVREGRKPDKTDIAREKEIAKRYKSYSKLKTQYDSLVVQQSSQERLDVAPGDNSPDANVWPGAAKERNGEREDQKSRSLAMGSPLHSGFPVHSPNIPGPQPQSRERTDVKSLGVVASPSPANLEAINMVDGAISGGSAQPTSFTSKWGASVELPANFVLANPSSFQHSGDGLSSSPRQSNSNAATTKFMEELSRKRKQSFGVVRSSTPDRASDVDAAFANPLVPSSDFQEFLVRKRQLDALQEEQKKRELEQKASSEVKTVVVQHVPQSRVSHSSKRLSLTQPEMKSSPAETPKPSLTLSADGSEIPDNHIVQSGPPRPPATRVGFVAEDEVDGQPNAIETKDSRRSNSADKGTRKKRNSATVEAPQKPDLSTPVKPARKSTSPRNTSRHEESESDDEIEIPDVARNGPVEQAGPEEDNDFEDPRSIVAPAPVVEEDRSRKRAEVKTVKGGGDKVGEAQEDEEKSSPLKEGEVDFPIFGRGFPATGLGLEAGGEEGVRALFRRIPQNTILRCKLYRKANLLDKNFPTFFLYNEVDEKLIAAAKKRKQVKGINYSISESAAEIKKESKHYIAKLRANPQRTMFVLYDARSYNNKATSKGLKELSMVEYSTTTLPREMSVAIPAATIPDDKLEGFTKDISNDFRMKAKEKLLFLRNKPPRWSEATQSHCLNFGGRVTMPSIKNFQLIADSDENLVLMQFGRCGPDYFTMDVRHPMTPMDALGVALSTFDAYDAA